MKIYSKQFPNRLKNQYKIWALMHLKDKIVQGSYALCVHMKKEKLKSGAKEKDLKIIHVETLNTPIK